MTSSVVATEHISATDVRTVLRFINKVLQVLDQAFEDVYACLVDVRLLSDADLGTSRLQEVRRSVALLKARSRYRDAEEICSRLHHLSEEYSRAISPIVSNVDDPRAWSQLFYLLNEY